MQTSRSERGLRCLGSGQSQQTSIMANDSTSSHSPSGAVTTWPKQAHKGSKHLRWEMGNSRLPSILCMHPTAVPASVIVETKKKKKKKNSFNESICPLFTYLWMKSSTHVHFSATKVSLLQAEQALLWHENEDLMLFALCLSQMCCVQKLTPEFYGKSLLRKSCFSVTIRSGLHEIGVPKRVIDTS